MSRACPRRVQPSRLQRGWQSVQLCAGSLSASPCLSATKCWRRFLGKPSATPTAQGRRICCRRPASASDRGSRERCDKNIDNATTCVITRWKATAQTPRGPRGPVGVRFSRVTARGGAGGRLAADRLALALGSAVSTRPRISRAGRDLGARADYLYLRLASAATSPVIPLPICLTGPEAAHGAGRPPPASLAKASSLSVMFCTFPSGKMTLRVPSVKRISLRPSVKCRSTCPFGKW